VETLFFRYFYFSVSFRTLDYKSINEIQEKFDIMEDQSQVLKFILLVKLRRRIKRRQRTMYIRPLFLRRNETGETTLLHDLREDPHYHFRYFRYR